ncbi:MAG: hypothetical protein R3Y10_06420 [Ferrimonas sp.]
MSHARRCLKQLLHRQPPAALAPLIAPPPKAVQSGLLSSLMAPLKTSDNRLKPKATGASYQCRQLMSNASLFTARRESKPLLWTPLEPLFNWLQGDGIHQDIAITSALLGSHTSLIGHRSKPQAAITGMRSLRTEPMMGRPQNTNRLRSPLKSPPCKRCPALAGGLCLCAQKQRVG